MKTESIICILCPNGCELDVTFDEATAPTTETIRVEGNLCPRGIDYAIEEILHPKRTLTTSVLVRGGRERLASVKTAQPIPREKLLDAREALRATVLQAPVEIGEIALADVVDTGIDVVVTRSVEVKR